MGDGNDIIIRNLNTTLESFTKITAKAMDSSPPSYLKSMNELLDSFSEITNPPNPDVSEPPAKSRSSGYGMFDSLKQMLQSGKQMFQSGLRSASSRPQTNNDLANLKMEPIIPPSDDFEYTFLMNENQNDYAEDAEDAEGAEGAEGDKMKKRAKGKSGKNNSRKSEWKTVEDCKITAKNPANASRNVEIKCEDNPDFNAKLPNTDIVGDVIQVNWDGKSKKKSIDHKPDDFGITMAYRPVGPRITKHSVAPPSK
jgi:hypothetical protein